MAVRIKLAEGGGGAAGFVHLYVACRAASMPGRHTGVGHPVERCMPPYWAYPSLVTVPADGTAPVQPPERASALLRRSMCLGGHPAQRP